MKIILTLNLIQSLFQDEDDVTVSRLLEHPFIKSKLMDCDILSVYKDTMDANNLNNWVIKVRPREVTDG